MKFTLPEARIIEDELKMLSVCQRIDSCAAICYQRPPKSREEDAQTFCKKFGVEHGHRAMLEFAVLHLIVPVFMADELRECKFLMVDDVSENESCVTGSIRAWMEFDSPTSRYVKDRLLSYHFPVFFGECPMPILCESPHNPIRFADPDKEEIPVTHIHVAARFIVNRAISHELVRHRPCSFLQESQRYVKYDGHVTFVRPLWAMKNGSSFENLFMDDCYECEQSYMERRRRGLSPQQSRGALNNDCKTEIVVSTYLGEWDLIFGLRCSPAADPEMQRVMVPLRDEFHAKYPNYPWRN